jgi:hypothetical protein
VVVVAGSHRAIAGARRLCCGAVHGGRAARCFGRQRETREFGASEVGRDRERQVVLDRWCWRCAVGQHCKEKGSLAGKLVGNFVNAILSL